MPTTSQILGWTPQEAAAAAFTASGEAGGGNDLGGVLQTIISRRALNPKSNVVSLVTAPQQFVANDRYTPQQVADPNFGRKVYGNRYAQALATLENPGLMSGFLQAGQGATSFRGQALLKNKLPGDIMFDKSGNFYFDKKPQVANQLIQALGKPAPIGLASGAQMPPQAGGNYGATGGFSYANPNPVTAPPAVPATTQPTISPADFLMSKIMQQALTPVTTPWSADAGDIQKQLADASKSTDYFDTSNLKAFGIKAPILPTMIGQ